MTHSVVDGHATPSSWPVLSIRLGLGVPGAVGLNVTSLPWVRSTAVHWLTDGHANAIRILPGSTAVGVGEPGAVGLKVTSFPLPSAAGRGVGAGAATWCTLLRRCSDVGGREMAR